MHVKVCGITRVEDALAAAELGASAIGLIFWPHTPRAVSERVAVDIVRSVPESVACVGVFVNQPSEWVRGVADRVGLTAVQLHGEETVAYCGAMNRPVIKSMMTRDGGDDAISDVPASVLLLLDAHDPVRRGGTGQTVDWTTAARIAGHRPIVLSGGLRPDNVREAISTVRPHAVDVASGVETAPGVKDLEKLRAFFEAVRDGGRDASGESFLYPLKQSEARA